MHKTPILDDTETRWQAVQTRDPAFDGRFWYGVKTTGVYCRPSCAARTPRRENVSFHDGCDPPKPPASGPASAASHAARRPKHSRRH
ncbi:MAG: Ada metal-binding domain-containing protein [Asticcacaulis sp.]